MKNSKHLLKQPFCIEVSGGLGNQMFQYAFGKSISIMKNIPFILDYKYFDLKPNDNAIIRPNELDVFELKAISANKEILNRYDDSIMFKINYILNKYLNFPILFKSNRINETINSLLNINELKNLENLFFSGYWQSEKYFKNIEDIIRNDFKFKKKLFGKNSALKKVIQNSNSVSIHIRRGDYVNNPSVFKTHGVCSIEYFRQAVALIKEHVNNPFFYIFSDDFEWVKQNDFGTSNYKFIDYNNGKSSYIDMQLMSNCKHNIIANSSFSWWGAWLNSNPEKIVITPKQWFANEQLNFRSENIVPKSWKRI